MTRRVVVGELPVGGSEPLISSAIRWGDLLFLSGRAPIDTTTMEVVSSDFGVQARSVMDQIVGLAGGSGLGPGARAPRAVLPPRPGALRRVERRSGRSTSRRRGRCGRRSSPGSLSRGC